MSLSIRRAMLAATSMLLVSAACEKGGGVAVEIPKDVTATEFVYENGDLGTADNSPMIGETFAFDTKTGRAQLASSSNFTSFSFSATADFRNTIFNFKKVPRDHRVITFATVNMNNGAEYYVALHAEHNPVVYFNKDHMVIPTDLTRLPRDGPFARLKFQCTKDGNAIEGSAIKIFGPSGLIGQVDSNGDGKAEVSIEHLSFPTVRFSATIPGRIDTVEGILALPIVGAVEDLIHYHSIPIGT